jgi:endonuclease/exonuclease/phosphatase (EEP) superfamily protein YafD
LTGDFNAPPESYIVKRLGASMLHAGPDYDVKTWTTKPHSYNGFEETDLNWRLDYVFTTPDIRAVSAQVIKTDYSDHLPVLVKVEV